MKIAITGSSGFLGQELTKFYARKNQVLGIQPAGAGRPMPAANCETVCFDFRKDALERLSPILKGCDMLFHCAYAADLPEDLPARLLDLYQRVSATGKFIYISSINVLVPALEGDPYTKSKQAAEKILFGFLPRIPALVVRPPFLVAAENPGNFRRIVKLAALFRIAPLFYPGPNHYPLDTTLFIKAMDEKSTRMASPGFYRFNVLGKEQRPLPEMIRSAVAQAVGGSVFFPRLPSAWVVNMMKIAPCGRGFMKSKIKLFKAIVYEPVDDGAGITVL